MAHYKILPKEIKNKFSKIENAELSFNNYLVAIVFTRNEFCLLSTLQFRLGATTDPWKIVASNIGEYDGEITVPLGAFNSESILQLTWLINAPVTKLSAVVIYVVNADTKKMVKVAPKEGVKTVDKGKSWLDENLNISLNF